MCGWVRETGWAVGAGMLQAVSIEPAQGKEKRRTRPINSAIVANQDHPGRVGTDGRDWKEDVFSSTAKNTVFYISARCFLCLALYVYYINLKLIFTFVLPHNYNYTYSQYD